MSLMWNSQAAHLRHRSHCAHSTHMWIRLDLLSLLYKVAHKGPRELDLLLIQGYSRIHQGSDQIFDLGSDRSSDPKGMYFIHKTHTHTHAPNPLSMLPSHNHFVEILHLQLKSNCIPIISYHKYKIASTYSQSLIWNDRTSSRIHLRVDSIFGRSAVRSVRNIDRINLAHNLKQAIIKDLNLHYYHMPCNLISASWMDI